MNAQAIQSLRGADFDGDGDRELIASFGGPSSSTSAILVCDVDAMGVPSGCRDLLSDIVALEPATLGCFDAVPGRFAFRSVTSVATAAEDLIVLCRDSGTTLYRVSNGADGVHVDVFARLRGSLSSLEVGDVTGDRIPDILGIEGEAGARSLVVFPQCTNRDTACVGAEVAP
jgi:hypothetical protein